jgi:hypothetical protein
MFNRLATAWFRWLGGVPCFRVYGKARFRGTCITWTAAVIAVGWDFAEEVLREQVAEPASREHPVEVLGGRLHDPERRSAAGSTAWGGASEILAHECGHTWQATRLGWAYLPVGAALTLFREGPRLWNCFENQASEQGLFGGMVNGSVCPELMERLRQPRPPSGE